MRRGSAPLGAVWTGTTLTQRAVGLAASAVCAIACQPARPPPPAATEAQLAQSARLGRAIFDQDEASAKATDLLTASGALRGTHPALSGWVTRSSSDGTTTLFVTRAATDEGAADVIYEVHQPRGAAPTFSAVDPPRAIDAEGAAMFRAEWLARSAVHSRCGDTYNPVVLPAALAGKEGWLVYLVAASTQPGARVLAGHHRLLVSADGNQVLEHTPLSASCIVAPPGGKSDASIVSSLVADYPSEAHFFTSTHYGTRLYVVMRNGSVWQVDPVPAATR